MRCQAASFHLYSAPLLLAAWQRRGRTAPPARLATWTKLIWRHTLRSTVMGPSFYLLKTRVRTCRASNFDHALSSPAPGVPALSCVLHSTDGPSTYGDLLLFSSSDFARARTCLPAPPHTPPHTHHPFPARAPRTTTRTRLAAAAARTLASFHAAPVDLPRQPSRHDAPLRPILLTLCTAHAHTPAPPRTTTTHPHAAPALPPPADITVPPPTTYHPLPRFYHHPPRAALPTRHRRARLPRGRLLGRTNPPCPPHPPYRRQRQPGVPAYANLPTVILPAMIILPSVNIAGRRSG